jgi:hypothetical protein
MVSCCSRNCALERETGIEPATSCLGSKRSTAELLPRCERSIGSLTTTGQAFFYRYLNHPLTTARRWRHAFE